MKKVRAGMLGIGNVGTGTIRALQMNRESIKNTAGVDVEIVKILNRHPELDRGIDIDRSLYVQDVDEILNDESIDMVVELIGGIEPATSYMSEALKRGKHVVTANKAALAVNGELLQKLAAENRVMFRFEASVCGGIPVIGALTTSLQSDSIDAVLGIVNGTTNYILTQMTDNGSDYDDALSDAQKKGFAEKDPSGDVKGDDAANKLSVLMSIIFGVKILPDEIPTQGITSVSSLDISFAAQFGYKVKLLASAKKSEDGKSLECNVSPALIPLSHPLASVSNEFNAVFVKGNAVDDVMFYGKGAGPLPTGSAVVGDMIEIAKAVEKGCAFDVRPLLRYDSELKFAGEGSSRYYVRTTALDRPGTLGKISSCFGDYGIGIESMVQSAVGENADSKVPVVFILYRADRSVLDKALKEMRDKSFVISVDSVIRVEK